MEKFHDILEKIEDSSEFKKLKKEDAGIFLSGGYFVFDYESGSETMQVDFFGKQGLVSFELNNGEVVSKKQETQSHEKFLEINQKNIKMEINDVVDIAKKEAEKAGIKKFAKIIAVLQMLDDSEVWNLTCMAGLKIFRIYVSAGSSLVIKQEALNLFDMMKFLPGKKEKSYIG